MSLGGEFYDDRTSSLRCLGERTLPLRRSGRVEDSGNVRLSVTHSSRGRLPYRSKGPRRLLAPGGRLAHQARKLSSIGAAARSYTGIRNPTPVCPVSETIRKCRARPFGAAVAPVEVPSFRRPPAPAYHRTPRIAVLAIAVHPTGRRRLRRSRSFQFVLRSPEGVDLLAPARFAEAESDSRQARGRARGGPWAIGRSVRPRGCPQSARVGRDPRVTLALLIFSKTLWRASPPSRSSPCAPSA